MPYIIILIGVALVWLSYSGKLKIPSWVGIGVIVVGIGFLAYDKFQFLGANTADKTLDTTQVNSCGCTQGQLTVLRYKPWIGKSRTSNVTCQVALNQVNSKPKRYSIIGCTTGAS